MSSTNVATSGPGIDVSGVDMSRFGEVSRQLKLDKVKSFATATRYKNEKALENSSAQGDTTIITPVICEIMGKPLCGSYNIVFCLEFEDGVEWVLKIRANGYDGRFDTLASTALISEVRTMQIIKDETTIPVPAIHTFNNNITSTKGSPIGVPYILMDHMAGTQLHYLWWDRTFTSTRREQIRARALQTISAAMVQLNSFKLTHSGSLKFDHKGKYAGTGAAKVPNPFRTNLNDEFCKQEPTDDPASFMLTMLDRRPPIYDHDVRMKGLHESRRLFTQWALEENTIEEEEQFVLAHMDFDLQNVLVKDDGTLCGIRDWDGVSAVPQSVGCLSYPKWLLHDWDPHYYNYNTETGQIIDSSRYADSSPQELSTYRALYAQFIEMELSMQAASRTSKRSADVTRMSMIMASLQLADSDPDRAFGIVQTIFKHIAELIIDDDDDEASGEEADGGKKDEEQQEGDASEKHEEDGKEEDCHQANGSRDSADTLAGSPGQAVRCKRCISEELRAASNEG